MIEAVINRELLDAAIECIAEEDWTEDEKFAVAESFFVRFPEPPTYEHIGLLMGISKQRVAQLEIVALRKMGRDRALASIAGAAPRFGQYEHSGDVRVRPKTPEERADARKRRMKRHRQREAERYRALKEQGGPEYRAMREATNARVRATRERQRTAKAGGGQ